jgi:hypothetical protein
LLFDFAAAVGERRCHRAVGGDDRGVAIGGVGAGLWGLDPALLFGGGFTVGRETLGVVVEIA